MPNILANKEIFPEFIQNEANPDNITKAGLRLLKDKSERQKILTSLENIANQLGEPGATYRASKHILDLIN
jgi:lipid-A-disaccharide synthase